MDEYIISEWTRDGVEIVSKGTGFIVCRLPARFQDLNTFIDSVTSSCGVQAVDSEISAQGGLQLRLWGENGIESEGAPAHCAVGSATAPTIDTPIWKRTFFLVVVAICLVVWRYYEPLVAEFKFYSGV